jgi:hypothetical protein
MTEREAFLSRWARLKREAAQGAAAVAPAAAQAESDPPLDPLPPLESLDFASDFTAFLQDKVEEAVKRAALKKLFHSPEFNVMDGLDVYIDDYGAPDPIPPQMLEELAHAREMLFGPRQQEGRQAAAGESEAAGEDSPPQAPAAAGREQEGTAVPPKPPSSEA